MGAIRRLRIVVDSVAQRTATANGVDLLYQVEASNDYDPAPQLEKIRAPLLAVNSADDQVNPPELGVMEREIKRVPRGRYVLIPIGDQTRGHGTHSLPRLGGYLAWNRRINRSRVKIAWKFDRKTARRKFGYKSKSLKL